MSEAQAIDEETQMLMGIEGLTAQSHKKGEGKTIWRKRPKEVTISPRKLHDGMCPPPCDGGAYEIEGLPILAKGRCQGLALFPLCRFHNHMEGDEEAILGEVLSSLKSNKD